MIQEREDLKGRFKTGMYPTEQDFANVFDSYFHKNEKIPAENVGDITEILNKNNEYILKEVNKLIGGAQSVIIAAQQDLENVELLNNKHYVSMHNVNADTYIQFKKLSGVVGIGRILIHNAGADDIIINIDEAEGLALLERKNEFLIAPDEFADITLTGFGEYQTITCRVKETEELPPDLEPDDYERGNEGSVHIAITNNGLDGQGFEHWNFDEWKYNDTGWFTGTYKTIHIGEHEWTAESLRARHRWSFSWLNYTDANIANITRTYDPRADEPPLSVRDFQKLNGNWFTFLGGGVTTYRNPNDRIFRTDKDGEEIEGWDLPSVEDFYQLIGQAPRPTGYVVRDTLNFVAARHEDAPENYITEWGGQFANLSGLTLTPLGSREPTVGDISTDVYAFKKLSSLFLKSWSSSFTFYVDYLSYNSYIYHYGQVRYCRRISAEELDYKLVIDEEKDKVLVLPPTQATDLEELPVGMERGVALRYMNRQYKVVLKSWSEIQEEATQILNGIRR